MRLTQLTNKRPTLHRLTQAEAAEFLGIGITLLYRLQRTGQLDGTYFRAGRRVLYMAEKLTAWMEAGGTKGGES